MGAFKNHDPDNTSIIMEDDVLGAFQEAGCADSSGDVPELHKEDMAENENGEYYLTLDHFIDVCSRFNKQVRMAFRENSGFSAQEIQDLKDNFAYYDEDGSGDICAKETIPLISELFPRMAHDPVLRPQLAALMGETRNLNFKEFMQVMSQLQEVTMEERISKELAALADTRFSSKEVEEFRELFLAGHIEHDSLCFFHLMEMLEAICPLGDKNMSELTALVRDITGRHVGLHGEAVPSVDFPEFLRLMRRLVDNNFGGLIELTAHHHQHV